MTAGVIARSARRLGAAARLARRFARRLGPAVRRRDGSAAVEFAIAAPTIVVAAATATGALFLHAGGVSLETGVAAAARGVVTGARPDGEDRAAAVRRIVTNHVCPSGGGFCFWDPSWISESDDGVVSPLRVTTRAYVDPRNIGRPEPFTDAAPENGVYDAGEAFLDVNENGVWDADMGRAEPGGGGDYVVFSVAMAQAVDNPLLRAVVGAQLIREARLVVRNEPF